MFGHHHHHGHGGHHQAPPPHEQTLFRIFCRADEAYCLTVRHDAVVLAPTNPRDEYQHWYKDMRHSTKVKDAEGQPAFALINRATGLAIKHSLGQSHPVKLLPRWNQATAGTLLHQLQGATRLLLRLPRWNQATAGTVLHLLGATRRGTGTATCLALWRLNRPSASTARPAKGTASPSGTAPCAWRQPTPGTSSSTG
ncbi:hydroxyproline-rich glycoprotein family protein [Zea mays]|uniref:Hydroxyproline-rich glycoprotein family protein n=1 Tax=Zea mays TaxID=4577 RepID=A0A1D6F4K1_MAIZE|nr:hydroxyproline-rich glycoprotein family protein [Zea mays]